MSRKLILFLGLLSTSIFLLALRRLHDITEWGFNWRLIVLHVRLHILGFGKIIVVASIGFAI